MPSLDPPHGPKPEFSGALRSLHAATILQAYGAFGLAAVAAAMFLVQQHDLKVHKLRALLSFLPSIQRLELITTRLTVVGMALLTFGLVAGAWLPRKDGASYFADAKVLWSGLIWLVYLEQLVAHKFFSRSARRFALGIIIAFVFLLLTFGITNLLSPLHRKEAAPATNSLSAAFPLPMKAKMVKQTPHPGPLPIGSADSADAERGKRSQPHGKATAASCSTTPAFYQISQRLFLLPGGEGQDEGEHNHQTAVSPLKPHLQNEGRPLAFLQ
jgi:hypothetical protein